ncbi:hypothetical protein EYR36_009288 [Pleurotus pulmonarius]|nr:hypothetical protein EYR36_009288 [Pleurotus pulmonarius]
MRTSTSSSPATKAPSLAALALKGEEYTLAENEITLMLDAKTVLIFFEPTSTLLETVQRATNTPIGIPSLGLVDGLPLLVYMVNGMVNVAANNILTEAQVLPLMQSTLEQNSKMSSEGFQLQLTPANAVEQAAMSIDSAVSATRSTKSYVSNLDPPAGVIGFKRGTLVYNVSVTITWLAWSANGTYNVTTSDPSLIQKYNLNWYTDLYSYATGADCRGKSSAEFTSAGGIVYTIAIDRGTMLRASDSAPRFLGPTSGYCSYYFIDSNQTGHHSGSSLRMDAYQPRGLDSQIDSQVRYNINFEQDMQMFNNNGNSAYTFKAQYTNSFTLDKFQLHEVLGDSGVDFSVDYNGYYDRWADPGFVTDKWWNPGVYEKVYREGWSHWIVRENLPADNLPINGLIVFSSSVGQHTLISKYSIGCRAFKSNCWRTTSDDKHVLIMSRLASFRGPSAPSPSPVPNPQSPSNKKKSRRSDALPDSSNFQPPSSPSRSATESTFHRKTRAYLLEFKAIANSWDDLVLIDGVRAAKCLVDARTELENSISLAPERRPRYHLVGEKLALAENKITELESIIVTLEKHFRRMNNIIDGLEALYFEATKAKGFQWVAKEPLWATWSLEKFVVSIPSVLPAYNRSLYECKNIVDTLRSHTTTFEVSREAINRWVQQPWLEEFGWDANWEELCAAEVEKWDS